MIYLLLYWEFFKIGLFSIGGGLATLPLLQQVIEKYGWITNQQLLDMIAIAESTPGPIGINVATFVGYDTADLVGGLVAPIGLATPSVIIILVIARYFIKFNQHPVVRGALSGIRPAVAGLIGFVAFKVGSGELLFSLKGSLLFIILLYLLNRFDQHPILYLLGAGLVGIIFNY
ncbi:chromate transporter [Halanaerobaculum tunisiense]